MTDTESIEEYTINSTKTVAVAIHTYWNYSMIDCPTGVKLQLLGSGGVASYGTYHGEKFWIGWCPMPKR